MDFDEYDYLEKTVENLDDSKDAIGARGRDGIYISKKRNEEDGYRQDDRSKKLRIYEEVDRRDRTGQERADRDRRDRGTLFEKERHRGETAVRERDRGERFKERIDKDRERDRDARDVDRDRREKEGSRDRDRVRHKEHERERGRDRSHSRSRDVDRHKERVVGRDKELKDRDKERESRDRDREKEFRPFRERREKKEEPPLAEPEADPERDQRTVFAYQICLKADERDVYEFFSKAGKVRDVRLIMDRNSRRSKGVGYIEFYDAMTVPVAIAMSGQLLRGQPVMVKPSEAEKNLVQSTATAAGVGGYIAPYSGGARRLYVGNLHFNITEDQLRQVFEPFGPVELVQLPTDLETGQCKGFGFVQYTRLEDARAAAQALNGVLELAGRVIKVSAVTEQSGMQDLGVTPGELDDDEGGGLSLTARSRTLLMQKLDRSGTVSSIAAVTTAPIINPALGLLAPVGNGFPSLMAGPPLGQVGLPGVAGVPNMGLTATSLGPAAVEPVGAPTDCLLLRNMFDPKTETEPDFDLDIKDEVQLECSKFGLVNHIFVDKDSGSLAEDCTSGSTRLPIYALRHGLIILPLGSCVVVMGLCPGISSYFPCLHVEQMLNLLEVQNLIWMQL